MSFDCHKLALQHKLYSKDMRSILSLMQMSVPQLEELLDDDELDSVDDDSVMLCKTIAQDKQDESFEKLALELDSALYHDFMSNEAQIIHESDEQDNAISNEILSHVDLDDISTSPDNERWYPFVSQQQAVQFMLSALEKERKTPKRKSSRHSSSFKEDMQRAWKSHPYGFDETDREHLRVERIYGRTAVLEWFDEQTVGVQLKLQGVTHSA